MVNNARFATYGPFAELNLNAELEMMQVNMVALPHLTKLLLPGMIRRRSGKILNVGSTASFVPGPFMAVNYATKAYVLSLSEALAEELRGTGVSVTALCPGPARSGFQQRARMQQSKLLTRGILDVDTVARAGYRALMRNQTIVLPGVRIRMLPFAVRLLPRRLLVWLTRRAKSSPRPRLRDVRSYTI